VTDLGALSPATALGAVALVGVLGYAAVQDVRIREVADPVWLVGGLAGAVIGLGPSILDGPTALACWLLVTALVLEHLVPWDAALERRAPWLPGVLETGAYVGVGVILGVLGAVNGIGGAGVPIVAVAVYLSVLIARALFEFGVLYGGADAKAVMVAALLVPVDPTPLVVPPASALTLLAYYPFTLTLLMDAALVAAVVPLALAARSLRAGTFVFPRSFTSYRIPVTDLPHRFVWLRDPLAEAGTDDDATTTEEDQQLRVRQAEELTARGVTEAWVTPQLPFVVFLAVGAVAAVLIGNVLFDLFAVL